MSETVVPEPFAIRAMRGVCFSRSSGFSISSGVMELIACFQRLAWDCCFSIASCGMFALFMPGTMESILSNEPTSPIVSS